LHWEIIIGADDPFWLRLHKFLYFRTKKRRKGRRNAPLTPPWGP
jgi:hypothetical protein